MKKSLLEFLLAVAISGGYAQASDQTPPRAAMTFRVVDEHGAPIKNAKAALWTDGNFVPHEVSGLTDDSGLFYAESTSLDGCLKGYVVKNGYYPSRTQKIQFGWGDVRDGKWVPWNRTMTAVLKAVSNPTALCAKRVACELPKLAESVGYDLGVGDWVTPFGKGVVSDFVFKGQYESRGINDYDESIVLSFSSPDDGIQPFYDDPDKGSVLRLRTAPGSGYEEKDWVRKVSARPIGTDYRKPEREDQCYVFRTRSRVKDGRIESANYGKLYGSIKWGDRVHGPSPAIHIEFTYYFNPVANDRNLEFDREKNILALGPREVPVAFP